MESQNPWCYVSTVVALGRWLGRERTRRKMSLWGNCVLICVLAVRSLVVETNPSLKYCQLPSCCPVLLRLFTLLSLTLKFSLKSPDCKFSRHHFSAHILLNVTLTILQFIFMATFFFKSVFLQEPSAPSQVVVSI